MNHCARCMAPPRPPQDTGTLCIAPPLAHTLGSLRGMLRDTDIPFDEPATNVLTIPLAPGRLRRLADALGSALSRAEMGDTRSVVLAEGAALTIDDLARMQPLATLVARIRGAWLPDLLAQDRLTTHFQPIVPTERPDEVFAYECLLRGIEPDGSLIPPSRIYQTARDADLLFHLDRAARLSAIRSAARLGLDANPEARLFINFNPTSIYDPAFCLRSTTAAIAETAFRPDQIVFEVVESDEVGDPGNLLRIVEFYRAAGFRVALDDLGSGYGSLNLLSELRPDYVKLDMALIRGVDRDPYKAAIVSKLLEMARGLGIASVAEGIETMAEWDWVRDRRADLVQGFLFARPASPPPQPVSPRREARMAVA